MFDKKLEGVKVAVLAASGFEYNELTKPRMALDEAGAETFIISTKAGRITGWANSDWGDSVAVDMTLDEASAFDFDALFIPGGVMSPDKLRMDKTVIKFVKTFVDAGKPIASICHGPQVLTETGMLDGRTMTSWPSLKTDFENAGANWVDEEVVSDNGLVTSRMPEDIPAFNKKMIDEFSEGIHDNSTMKMKSKEKQPDIDKFFR